MTKKMRLRAGWFLPRDLGVKLDALEWRGGFFYVSD